MKKIGAIFLVLLFYSCNERKDASPMVNVGDVQELKHKALIEGDTIAYDELSLDYMDSPYEGFLYTALVMANKYEYPPAYIDVYYCLTGLKNKRSNEELDDLDKSTRELALKYLIDGSEKGNKDCMQILGFHFLKGRYLPKDQARGDSLIKQSE